MHARCANQPGRIQGTTQDKMGLNAEIPTEIKNDTAYQIVTACFGVTIFLSLVGNGLLFFVFYRGKRLRDLSTVLIIQMSVSNVIYTCIELAFVVIKGLRLNLSTWGCKIFVYVNGVSRASTSLFLLAVCFERSTAICSPTLCYSLRKIPAIKTKVCVAAWLIAIVLRTGVPFLACDSEKVSPGYRIAVVLITYIIPFFLELSAYMAASRKIKHGLRSSERSRYLLLFMKKSMNVFGLIVVIFTICVLPTSIVTIIEAFDYEGLISPLTRYVLDMIEAVPCATTVICYSVCSPKFRQEILNLFLPDRTEENLEFPRSNPRWFTPRVSGRAPSEERADEHNKALREATRRLDWIFGDDPSEIIVAATSPDTPLGNLKDLSLAMTLKMEDNIQTIPEISEESTEHFQCGADSRPSPRASTWPRRGNTGNIRSERKALTDGKVKDCVPSNCTGKAPLENEGTSRGCKLGNETDSSGLTKL